MKRLLRVSGARFARDGAEVVTAFDLMVGPGERAVVWQRTSEAASLAARICACIVKPTSGTVQVGDYDSRVQPAFAKRGVGFVDAVGFWGDDARFRRQMRFHADVWAVAQTLAARRVAEVLGVLDGVDRAYARAVALALVADPAVVVLDHARAGLFERLAALRPQAALVATGTPAFAATYDVRTLLAERAETLV